MGADLNKMDDVPLEVETGGKDLPKASALLEGFISKQVEKQDNNPEAKDRVLEEANELRRQFSKDHEGLQTNINKNKEQIVAESKSGLQSLMSELAPVKEFLQDLKGIKNLNSLVQLGENGKEFKRILLSGKVFSNEEEEILYTVLTQPSKIEELFQKFKEFNGKEYSFPTDTKSLNAFLDDFTNLDKFDKPNSITSRVEGKSVSNEQYIEKKQGSELLDSMVNDFKSIQSELDGYFKSGVGDIEAVEVCIAQMIKILKNTLGVNRETGMLMINDVKTMQSQYFMFFQKTNEDKLLKLKLSGEITESDYFELSSRNKDSGLDVRTMKDVLACIKNIPKINEKDKVLREIDTKVIVLNKIQKYDNKVGALIKNFHNAKESFHDLGSKVSNKDLAQLLDKSIKAVNNYFIPKNGANIAKILQKAAKSDEMKAGVPEKVEPLDIKRDTMSVVGSVQGKLNTLLPPKQKKREKPKIDYAGGAYGEVYKIFQTELTETISTEFTKMNFDTPADMDREYSKEFKSKEDIIDDVKKEKYLGKGASESRIRNKSVSKDGKRMMKDGKLFMLSKSGIQLEATHGKVTENKTVSKEAEADLDEALDEADRKVEGVRSEVTELRSRIQEADKQGIDTTKLRGELQDKELALDQAVDQSKQEKEEARAQFEAAMKDAFDYEVDKELEEKNEKTLAFLENIGYHYLPESLRIEIEEGRLIPDLGPDFEINIVNFDPVNGQFGEGLMESETSVRGEQIMVALMNKLITGNPYGIVEGSVPGSEDSEPLINMGLYKHFSVDGNIPTPSQSLAFMTKLRQAGFITASGMINVEKAEANLLKEVKTDKEAPTP